MIKSIKTKIYKLIRWMTKDRTHLYLSTIVILVLISLVFSIMIHEIGHVLAADLLGYEYSILFLNDGIAVGISNMDSNSLDPFITGVSGGYLAVLVLTPLTYFSSKLRQKQGLSHNEKILTFNVWAIFATHLIFQFVYGTLEGFYNQTNIVSIEMASIVALTVASICLVIMVLSEDPDLNRTSHGHEGATDVKNILSSTHQGDMKWRLENHGDEYKLELEDKSISFTEFNIINDDKIAEFVRRQKSPLIMDADHLPDTLVKLARVSDD